MKVKIAELLNQLYSQAELLKGISLGEEPLRFDVAAPIITEWTDIPHERLESITSTRNPKKFLLSIVSVANVQIPVDRKDTKQIIDKGISFVSVLFSRNDDGDPAIMLIAYIPEDKKCLEFERLTSMMSKTYCPEKGISWENLYEDVSALGIQEEFLMIVDEFQKSVNEVKDREELEKKIHKTIIKFN
ncbi:MAG: hypothetical protein R2771_12610 [Saprospiraceae bacterium]